MTHHPDIELILAYASGQLEPALAVAVALHQAQCEKCSEAVRAIEAEGGSTLDNLDSEPAPDFSLQGFDRLLAEIGELPVVVDTPYQALAVADSELSLVEKLDEQRFNEFRWEKVTSQLQRAEIEIEGADWHIELIKLAPRGKIPRHTHRGRELTVVLQGEFNDLGGTYGEGAFICQGPADDHQPIAGDRGCICLALTEAPLKFTGALGPVYNWLGRSGAA